ncbi:dTDP-4-keto-6-deoxy-D-glucose epimerase [Microbacterium sp. CFH 90308]|uniref:dTDP-4-keto-6-deoxy-D-glucose epimerase n=1 Tax=Microbacterium salsuginis TaxID=2722803 RepID=A0ABX1KC26_9MICO|nr:dTDP-4-dehydrorhamnose 3,5-epimerase family protein [Microbacterium sp. CFH 90308]NLP83920.1 dTDP-4-keto-6-deoxy-D-glucose epimerase [Microbacterium sp. CFH 90308]
MHVRPLSIPGSFEFTPRQFDDNRGSFAEWYRFEPLEEAVGHALDLRQANISRSAKGVLRGIHYVDLPGQGKYVTCAYGAVLDFVVDIRVGSPTFGQWDTVLLDDKDRRAIYISEGLGHAYVSLEEDSIVTYLCSNVYNGDTEGAIQPQDPTVALTFPPELGSPILSDKDTVAPTLQELLEAGSLPTWEEARRYFRQ